MFLITDRVLDAAHPDQLNILSKVAEEFTEDEYSGLLKLKTDMIKVMNDNNGKGLAAPQVGLNKRVFVMKTSSDTLFIANPVIIKASSMRMKYKEGCLSLPNKSVTTNRSRQVTVLYIDELGKEQTIRLGGVDAVCVQHEIDHLDGILMTKYKR